jgi:gliding motility-associated-like protein
MPKSIQLFFIVFLLSFFFSAPLWATHNRAGEISIEQIGNCNESLSIRATLVTYTKASSRPADRDSLTICWGDGTCTVVYRVNGPGGLPQGELLENDVKKNIYIGTHTFPARGTYTISMTDPNRNGGILNLNYPNSEQIKFHIETVYTFPNPQFQGCNNTPVLLQPPLDIACVGQVFIHNPNAFDEDGDSLAYRLTIPQQDAGLAVPNYRFPDQISPGPDNQLTINETTGDLIWNAPQRAGEYNVTIQIIEFRDGIAIDTMTRDMQILVENCSNLAPEVETSVEEICVVAGETVEITVTATAPLDEPAQRVTLTALGGPFEVGFNPAEFLPITEGYQPDPLTKKLVWQTTCEHISDQYYTVVFKATDDYFGGTSGIATLKTVRIKVVGPSPQNLAAVSETGIIFLSWDQPYACDMVADDFFRGFSVWRKIGSEPLPLDTCNPGMDGRNYELLTPVPISNFNDTSYFFIDSTLERGRTYCYRIVANFARTTPGGLYTFNPVQSLPSNEFCIQLKQDVPLLIKSDVIRTDLLEGAVDVCWVKPIPEDLDTLLHPGPYTYELLRENGPDNFIPISGATQTIPSFNSPLDTCFEDRNINTILDQPNYKMNFYVSGSPIPFGASSPATTVYLTAAPTDKAIDLNWAYNVPWSNFRHIVYRSTSLNGDYEPIATVQNPFWKDPNLINGTEYCYFTETIGNYGTSNLPDTILNKSQRVCAIPYDNVPPCTPTEIDIRNLCNQDVEPLDCDNREPTSNTISWTQPETCGETDVAGYRVYFSLHDSLPLELIGTINNPNIKSFVHEQQDNLAGCYAISAFDFNGNESLPSVKVCIDNCPNYQLPNTFTPNGDGQNDLFTPYPFCFIEAVNFIVYNRWGQMVFKTNDPQLNWDGKNMNGEDLPDATYYYQCSVIEAVNDSGNQEAIQLNGFIELIRRN